MGCSNVLTLGVRPNFQDYSRKDAELILNAETVYYPSSFYAPMFRAMGKRTFPDSRVYDFAQDKISQTALFKMAGIPHPKTRVYYGSRQQEEIVNDFKFPFVAKIPRGSAMGAGVFLIKDREGLNSYLEKVHAAYIQEHLKIDRDLRVVVIGDEAALAYWRKAPGDGFLNNVAAGGKIDFDDVPQEAVDFALAAAKKCGWNDVGLDIAMDEKGPLMIEGNMKYGTTGFEKAGINYKQYMEKLIADGKI